MRIQKLNWAGINLSLNDRSVLIDAVDDFSYYQPILGDAVNTVLKFSDTIAADYILFTHLHNDHFDSKLIRKCLKPSGKIIVWSALYEKVRHHFEEFEMIVLETDEPFAENGIVFKPVYAMDGIGDIQCSWIVEGEGKRIFHGGDTIWHNQFWKLGKNNGPIDYAFLPVNGVRVAFPMIGLEYSAVPASMDLEQALNAAKLLHAGKLIPIHYGLFEHPIHYQPQHFGDEDLKKLSLKTAQPYQILNDGTWLD